MWIISCIFVFLRKLFVSVCFFVCVCIPCVYMIECARACICVLVHICVCVCLCVVVYLFICVDKQNNTTICPHVHVSHLPTYGEYTSALEREITGRP